MSSVRRRGGALVVLLALLVTGCGAGGGPDGGGDGGGDTRTVPHARGETAVPATPQRVVVLEPVALDTAASVGTVPVGTAVLSEATGIPAYLGEPVRATQSVGTVAEPDLERIAALTPDLVIGMETRHSEIYDQLAAIAPTVFLRSQDDPWQDNARAVGQALGRDVEPQLRRYTDRCAEIAQTFRTEGRTAQLIRPRPDMLSLYSPTSFAGSTLECAGFTLPPRDWQDSISVGLSPELVLQARADEVFVTAVDPASPAAIPPALAAVREQAFPTLHTVDQSSWITGVGPLGGLAVLDDIERILAGG